MLAKLIKTTTVALMLSGSLMAQQLGATLYGSKGDLEETYKEVLEEMEELGYILSDPHERINDAYKTKYGSTKLDNLGFFSTTKDAAVRELLEKHPKLGGFSPFNLHIWKVTGVDETWYGHLNPETMLDIVGIKDADSRKKFIASFEDIDALIKDKMKPAMERKLSYDALPARTMMEFEVAIELDEDEELTDFVDDFQGKWEEAFEKAGYIVAGYKNFKETYTDMGKKFNYDAYWVYSLCHFPFSNGVFNDRPDAGVFAPCSVYMYVEKGGKTLKIGMPMLENWIVVNGIKNEEFKKSIRGIDTEIISIFKTKLNAKEVK